MTELLCSLYCRGQLVADDLKVWLNPPTGGDRAGIFHVPANLEFSVGAKYRMEFPAGRASKSPSLDLRSLDVIITGIGGRIAHFATVG